MSTLVWKFDVFIGPIDWRVTMTIRLCPVPQLGASEDLPPSVLYAAMVSSVLDWSICTCLTQLYSCVTQVHTLQSSLIISTTGMTNLMRVNLPLSFPVQLYATSSVNTAPAARENCIFHKPSSRIAHLCIKCGILVFMKRWRTKTATSD